MHPDLERLARIHDLDLLVAELSSSRYTLFTEELGLPTGSRSPLEQERQRLARDLGPQLAAYYQRLQATRARPIVPMRNGVCQGCFVRRPTRAAAAQPSPGLERCEKCGRILFREPQSRWPPG
jgi:predicted  nucleic acid-binding Zn-ribbon protein